MRTAIVFLWSVAAYLALFSLFVTRYATLPAVVFTVIAFVATATLWREPR